ncbi:MAG: hypothetical protein Q9O62_07985 [Ardenticatenia bacterium]|nr:hypothetical protein [Ardenticatenia bacterium]
MNEPTTFVLPVRTKSDEELEHEGWKRRFVVAPARLEETVELYRSLGYDIHLEPLSPDELEEQCRECRLAVAFFRVLYTRPRRWPEAHSP